MEERIVTITAGAIRGLREDGVSKFLGVPYAASPTGARRFALPEPHAPWTEVRDATQSGPNAPQAVRDLGGALDPVPLVGAGWVKGDDFLSVNVWTPDEKAKGLPVMVFVHGGAFVVGSKDAPINDGTEFARAGVVLVAINYRLGIEGFLPIPGAPANLGLHDQLEAFRWVKANAAAFGGDPDNVTVFGESAGAMTIANLVASPASQGLFRRAIVESGHCAMVRKPKVAAKVVRKIAAILGVKPTLEGFRSATLDACVDAMEKSQQPTLKIDLRDENGLEPTFGLSKFAPVTGDSLLPEDPIALLKKGAGKDVDLLIGTNLEEMSLYFGPLDIDKKVNGLVAWMLLRNSVRNAWDILKAYGMGKRVGGKRITGGRALIDALTDLVFRSPARTMALAHQGRTHMYEFDYRSEAMDGKLGACHALDVPFVFKTLKAAGGPRGIAGDNPPQALAERCMKVWVDFARDGTFPAEDYKTASRPIFHLNIGRAVSDPPRAADAFLTR